MSCTEDLSFHQKAKDEALICAEMMEVEPDWLIWALGLNRRTMD